MSSKQVNFTSPHDKLRHRDDEDSVNKKKGNFVMRLPKCSRFSSPVRLLKFLQSKVAKALCCVPMRRRNMRRRRSSSGKIISTSTNFTRSRSLSESVDRAEAIEDCIEFLNSSSNSSLHRSSFSVSSTY
ncbi:hypothetical protein ACFE04_030895 [Oxalis oulophora]